MAKNNSSTAVITVDKNESANLDVLLKGKYKKSNFLIGAKYQSKLLENQILAISLANADKFTKDEKGVLVSATKAKDIITLLGKNDGSFYTTLQRIANRMNKRNLGIINPENNEFDFINLVIRARLKGGIFYIHYNPYFEDYLIEVQKNYTEFNLKIMLKFKSVYAFRLYELIKSQCYYINKAPNSQNMYHISFNLAELMLELGAIDGEDNDVKNELFHKNKPDYDLAVGIQEDKKITWGNFKKALDKAIKEINSDKEIKMYIEYDTIKSGKGGRVSRVIFTAEVGRELLNADQLEEEQEILDKRELTDEQKEDFYDDMREFIDDKLRTKDLRAIAEAANYNMNVIKEKYSIATTQEIDNIVGWMVAAIKNDYSTPISSSPKATKKKKGSWDIEERDYNFDEIEKVLIEN